MKHSYSVVEEAGYKRIRLPKEVSFIETILMDMESFSSPIFLKYIERVLSGVEEKIVIGGNMTALEITEETTTCKIDFATDGELSEYQIQTLELKEIIELWFRLNGDFVKDQGG